MNALPVATLTATLLIAATPYSKDVNAAARLQRCQGEDGSVLYTDKACGALGVKATPFPRELITRIAFADALPTNGDAKRPAPVARRSLANGCARTPTQLAMDLRGAFALGDVNRIAESYHWTGLSHKQGQRIMARLDQLSSKPISNVHYFSAQIGSAGLDGYADADTGNAHAGNAGVMQVTFGTGASASMNDFDVEKNSDCYFIRF